jgi:hypothetical protein
MTGDQNNAETRQIGYRLGAEAIERAADEAQTLCAWEKRRIQKLAAPEETRLRARYQALTEQRRELQNLVWLAPALDVASLRVTRNLYWALAVVLVVASVLFAHMALVPFGLGWETWGFSLAIGLVAAFWTDQTLGECGCKRLLQTICAGALGASLLGLLILAIVRGDILALYLRTALASDPGASSGIGGEAATGFYASAVWKLQALFALLALAMELASGMAVHRARGLHVGPTRRPRKRSTRFPRLKRN